MRIHILLQNIQDTSSNSLNCWKLCKKIILIDQGITTLYTDLCSQDPYRCHGNNVRLTFQSRIGSTPLFLPSPPIVPFRREIK